MTLRRSSDIEQHREFVELGIGRGGSAARGAIGARQRLAVNIEDVRHPPQRVQVDVAEQRPHGDGSPSPVLSKVGKSTRETGIELAFSIAERAIANGSNWRFGAVVTAALPFPA